MKRNIIIISLLLFAAMYVFASCKSHSQWGKTDANTPAKFRADKRYIK